MAEEKFNPEDPQQPDDQVPDPLTEAERILNDVPDESVEPDETASAAEQEALAPDEDAAAAVDDGLSVTTADREAELEGDLRRVQAEYVNYRRRVERDRLLEKDRVKGHLIAELMPVLDDISAARQAGDLAEGPFAHIATRLEQVLTQQGLQALGEVGEAFDPTIHEAIMQQPSEEVEADHVAVVVRSGYRHGERLLRAAQVIVSTGPAS